MMQILEKIKSNYQKALYYTVFDNFWPKMMKY